MTDYNKNNLWMAGPSGGPGSYGGYGTGAPPYVFQTAGGNGGFMDRTTGGGSGSSYSGITNWLKTHLRDATEIATTLAGIGTTVYAAKKQGQASEAELAQRDRQFQQQYGLDARQTALNEQEFAAKQAQYEAEMARRLRAYTESQAMQGAPQYASAGAYIDKYGAK